MGMMSGKDRVGNPEVSILLVHRKAVRESMQ